MYAIQNTLRIIATISGMVVILAALASVLLQSKREKSHSIGTGPSVRRWPAVIMVTIILLIIGYIFWKPLPVHMLINTEYLLTWIGFVIYIPAVLLYLSGLLTLGKYFGVSSTQGADLYSGHQLVKKGPFRYVRHPMYLAVILASIGAFLIFRTWAMLIFLPMSTVVIRRASQEEKLLETAFGDEWRSYVKNVRKWIPCAFRKNDTT